MPVRTMRESLLLLLVVLLALCASSIAQFSSSFFTQTAEEEEELNDYTVIAPTQDLKQPEMQSGVLIRYCVG